MSMRQTLDDFGSIVCFKALIVGVEDTLGSDGASVVFTRAGKIRGHNLVASLGLTGSQLPLETLAHSLDTALGPQGTRLCRVHRAYQDGEDVVIETSDTMCSAGEDPGSERNCTFTLGAVWGALEAITGEIYLGRQSESVLRGGSSDKFVFSPL